jgi:hypothetical protein
MKETKIVHENEKKYDYPFLDSLSEDHTELAKSISEKIPQWKNWMNQELKKPEITEAILQSIDYVSAKEMAQIIENWVKEIADDLEANPDRNIIILRGVGDSKGYFEEMVYQQLPESLKNRVALRGNEQTNNDLSTLTRDFDSFIKTDF